MSVASNLFSCLGVLLDDPEQVDVEVVANVTHDVHHVMKVHAVDEQNIEDGRQHGAHERGCKQAETWGVCVKNDHAKWNDHTQLR